ncbi:MAG: citrate/2-methylcitrate synthase [Candidatus Binataceae bacterium]
MTCALDLGAARWRHDGVAAHPSTEPPQMLTAAEAAAQLGVKLGTLYAYVSRGWLKSYRRKVGRQALYRRADIEALRGVTAPERGRRARGLPDASSWVTVAQPPTADAAAPGVIVAESAVSSIIEGRLAYRGYPIDELVERASFEEVCLLLWNGARPSVEESESLRSEIGDARMPPSVAAALTAVGSQLPPLIRLTVMMPSLAAFERKTPARPRIAQARLIVSMLPLALARAPASETDGVVAKTHPGGVAGSLFAGVVGNCADWEVAALDRVLIACAEHELNASTFAARVVASTGADLYASVLAALCSLSGPIHGGACDRIEAMFDQLEPGTHLTELLAGYAEKRLLPPGFGHAIYPAGDPRAVLLKKVAVSLAKHKGKRLLETAFKVEEAVWKRDRLRPNLDFYLTVCVRMLGFPLRMPAAVFALGRASGWIAHSLEQYADNRLIRPRMRYRGMALHHWL